MEVENDFLESSIFVLVLQESDEPSFVNMPANCQVVYRLVELLEEAGAKGNYWKLSMSD